MIGIGTPNSQSKIPRPMKVSPETVASSIATQCVGMNFVPDRAKKLRDAYRWQPHSVQQ